MRTLARRSIQTITNRTQVVSSFVDDNSLNEFFVRRLSDRISPNRQLFIVTLNNVHSDGEVIPFAEISMSNEKIRYIVKPSDQYPQLVDSRLIERIEGAIEMYMKNKWNNNLH